MKLFNEITLFAEGPDLLKAVLEEIVIDTDGTINDKLNLIACEIWRHLRKVINQFTFIVLKAREGPGWFTSDNPVIIDSFLLVIISRLR